MINIRLIKQEKYKLTTKMDFGRYREKTVKHILDSDPIYLSWCLENIPSFKVSKKLSEKIHEYSANAYYDRYEGLGFGDWEDIF